MNKLEADGEKLDWEILIQEAAKMDIDEEMIK